MIVQFNKNRRNGIQLFAVMNGRGSEHLEQASEKQQQQQQQQQMKMNSVLRAQETQMCTSNVNKKCVWSRVSQQCF